MTPKQVQITLSTGLLLSLVLIGGCRARSAVQAEQAESAAAPPRPHILIVVIDTLRADRLGCYGDTRGLTPTMDAWAAEGVLFEQAIAPSPWTLPSIASLFTATYPPVHGANSSRYLPNAPRGARATVRGIPENLPTLFEALAEAGYTGLGLSANHFLKSGRGFNRGFELWSFNDFVDTNRGAHLNQTAFKWLNDANFAVPHFVYLHYMDPHEPYWAKDQLVERLVDELPEPAQMQPVDNPQRSLYRRSMRAYGNDPRHLRLARYVEYWQARYDAGVAQVDVALADLQRELESLGLWDELFVILTADHGEALGEHGRWSHGDTTLHVELHVPLIMRWPGHLPAGKRITPLVSLIDTLPTVCDAIRVPVPHRVQGRSLLDLIEFDDVERSELSDTPIFASGVQRRPNEFAVMFKNWKLRVDPTQDLLTFHLLDGDPGEKENLAQTFTGEVQMLQELLAQHQAESASLARGRTAKTETLSPEDIEALRSLGYLGGGDE